MGLPGMNDDGSPAARTSDHDRILRDINGPQRSGPAGKSMATATVLQLVFGYVGAGYFYLEETKKALLSAVAFMGGGAAVVYMEMLVFPGRGELNRSLSSLHYVALALFAVLAFAYFYAAYDCYRLGSASQKRRKSGGWGLTQNVRAPTHEERMEQVFREHDKSDY
jgi:hypothetical protein